MNRKSASNVATLAIFIATMLIIEVLSQLVFSFLALPIKPTITHIPIIIASVLYGPKVGAKLGLFMGIMSIIRNTIIISPLSYVFSPFVPHGNFYSLIIAILPRVLIGITPYFVYKLLPNQIGLILSGLTGTLTNTIFVLLGIFIFFSNVYQGNIELLLAGIVSVNSIAEMLIASLLTFTIIPRIESLKK